MVFKVLERLRYSLITLLGMAFLTLFPFPSRAFTSVGTIGLGKAPLVESWLRYCGATIEVGGIVIMVLGLLLATWVFLRNWWRRGSFENLYKEYRSNLGRAIMLGLEVLIVADIVGTVAVSPSMENLKILGFIILIRTFLSFALEIEINGYWPWRKKEMETFESTN